MYCLLIRQKLDGIMFQIVVSILKLTQDMVSILQSMFIMIISILMSMSNQDKLEEFKVPTQVSSFQRVNSADDKTVLKYA
jgi:hypothetical protein